MKPRFLLLGLVVTALFSTSRSKNYPNGSDIRKAVNFMDEDWSHKHRWPKAINALNPVKVYGDAPNVVIALSVKDGIESGYYFFNPKSSFQGLSSTVSQIGRMPDGWISKPGGWMIGPLEEGGIRPYTRKRNEPIR